MNFRSSVGIRDVSGIIDVETIPLERERRRRLSSAHALILLAKES